MRAVFWFWKKTLRGDRRRKREISASNQFFGFFKKWFGRGCLFGRYAYTYLEFYSPKYTLENINSEKPDHRITLYWNPNLITKEGKASISFFTSDDISKYKISVEGLTNEGKICIGTYDFKVE